MNCHITQQPVQIVIGEIEKVTDNLYSAKSSSANGETIYLGMEQITNERYPLWYDYTKKAGRCALDIFNSSSLGFEGTEEREFENLLRARNLNTRENALPLTYVGGAIEGWFIAGTGAFAVYASTRPITAPLLLPDFRGKNITVKEFFTNYDSIILSVCARTITDKPLLEIRGIFRNPQWVVQGGYGNISMQLPAFAARVVQKHIDPSITHLTAAPYKKMTQIFIDSLGAENVQMGEEIPKELYHRSGSGPEDNLLLVTMEALRNLYAERAPSSDA